MTNLNMQNYRFETIQVSNMSEGFQSTCKHGEASNAAYWWKGKHDTQKIKT